MSKDEVAGLVRHLMTTLGGIAVAHGYIGASDAEAAAGAIAVLAGLVWSIVSKRLKGAPV